MVCVRIIHTQQTSDDSSDETSDGSSASSYNAANNESDAKFVCSSEAGSQFLFALSSAYVCLLHLHLFTL